MKIRLPNSSQRTVLVGRTGTGKTVAGLWHLSNYDFLPGRPWVAIDFKIDEHINSIERANHVDLDYRFHKKDAGLFVVHPNYSEKGNTELDKFLLRIWERENIGVFCDEGFMLGSSDAVTMCLTQGRSKRIPMILCTQRPVWISRFAFSEADFIQCFDLNDKNDKRRIEEFVPLDFDEEKPLAEHQSFYYDVAKKHLVRFNPVPGMDATRQLLEEKLPRRRFRL